MPANQRKQTKQTAAPPPAQATAKHTSKDASKQIGVPRTSTTSDSSETSLAMAQSTKGSGQVPTDPTSNAPPTVNRKKQKRREKQAAKLAAQQIDGTASNSDVQKQMQELAAQFQQHGLDDQYEDGGYDAARGEQYYSDEDAYSGSYGNGGSPRNGYAQSSAHAGGKLKRKAKGGSTHSSTYHNAPNGYQHNHVSPPMPPMPATSQRGPGISKEKIWNTSSQEERERIKEFWLSLGEDERKSLVKVEKDAVLKKMKEQQKHSCSCTICGRKRTAIEEELEVLYDAYYEELELYANRRGENGGVPPMLPPPRRFGALGGLQPPHRLPPAFNGQQPSRGCIVEQLGDDEEEDMDDDYSGEEDEEGYSEEEPTELPRSYAADFFNFGNSLTVQGGILTVADDLLKNDGKKFIEMMEQLAERRMAREEDAHQQYSNPTYGHPPNGALHSHPHTHNHPPLPDEDVDYDDEEEEEEEYDSQDEEYDDEELDTMTEEQRMEEGRRMFQIFAARMFEQRVLTAYKEKVAKERQQKLLEELEDESRADLQKKAKKAKDAQKKKDKVQQKKQALAEEKAKRDAEKAAEEAALRAEEEKKQEEQRLKAEERRKKRDAQKRAEEEERMKKEAEKQRRLQDQRDKQAEVERKQREAKERERKEKEEQRQKEREAKEAKEREVKERKEKQEQEKRDKEAKAKAEREAWEKQKRDEIQAQQQAAALAANNAAQATKRQQQPHPVPKPASVASVGPSPHVQVATPAVPKAPTPIKLRTSSEQESSGSSIPATPLTGPKSQTVSPHPSTPLQGSPSAAGGKGPNAQHPFLHQPQASSPIHAALKGPPGPLQGLPYSGTQQIGMGFQPAMPTMAPGFGGRSQDPVFTQQQFMAGQFRPMTGPNGMPIQPTLPMSQIPQGRGFPMPQPPPGFPQQMANGPSLTQAFTHKEAAPPQSHSRNPSASFEKPFEPLNPAQQAQPIARPAPIGRPSSVVHGNRQTDSAKNDFDELSNHLGSSALLDDSDETWNSRGGQRRSSLAPGNMPRQNFAPAPFGMDASFGNPLNPYNTWGAPPNPFATSLPGQGFGGGWGQSSVNSSFGSSGGPPVGRSFHQQRSVAVRLMICRSCKSLEGSTPDGFIDINVIKEHIDLLNPPNEQPVAEKELLDICDTEGSPMNGGGSFMIRNEGNDRHFIRYEAEALPANTNARPIGAPGEIGSPIIGNGGMARFGGPPGF